MGRTTFLDDLLADPQQREIADEVRDTTHGRSLLHIAAKNGDLDTAEIVLDSTYLDPADTDGKGRTALHLAALYGHIEMVALLLDNAQPAGPEGQARLTEATDDNGKTASDLLCQRWEPILAAGVERPPDDVIRMEKLRVKGDLEYVLDPGREQREIEEMKEMDEEAQV